MKIKKIERWGRETRACTHTHTHTTLYWLWVPWFYKRIFCHKKFIYCISSNLRRTFFTFKNFWNWGVCYIWWHR
jgi:hypothetical protein